MRKLKLRFGLLLFTITLLTFNSVSATKGGKLKMWYDKPATVWNEALPVGNGRLGAMIYGDPVNEKVQLNEDTFWSGGPSRSDNPDALKSLPQVRQLIFDGKFKEAEDLINQSIRAKELHGSMYQVVGNLNLAFAGHENYTEYYRELDLEKAIFTTSYKVDGVTFKREVFASQPDQVVVVRLTADQPGKLTFASSLDGKLQKSSTALDANTLEMTGLSATHEGVTGQVRFDARAKIINQGGSISFEGDRINVNDANEVVILISIATNFVDYQTLTANEVEKSTQFLNSASKKTFNLLLDSHIAAFQKYFKRVSLDLGTSPAAEQPTDVRIKNFSQSNDPELVSMYYQFGRYLLICSSQPGGQPANLQGIWNESTNSAWDSKYTININTEMNYWPAEKCNLSEMHEPLIQMVRELSQTGRKTAKDMYGCDGWVAHHNTDIWRISGVVDGAFWGMWPMGSAWLSQHLWEKYMYGGDLKYLESVYPVMKSACEFYQDFLIEEPTHKWLVVIPSISPENSPAGHETSVTAGTTMDNQILFDLFTKTIKAATLLKKDNDLMTEFQKTLDRMPPMQIGQYGQLQEWMEDLDNPNFFDAHPPFQIDGNFGCTSGITEMLMQSHDGAIHLLPALPDDWKNGEISGLRTQGGFEVSFKWENGQVQKIEIKSTLGGNCRIRVPNDVALAKGKDLKTASGTNPNPFFETVNVKNPIVSESAKLNELNLAETQLYDLPTEAGKIYSLVIK